MSTSLPSEALQGALQIIDRLLDLFHFPIELARVDFDPRATSADKCLVVLKPSDGLLGLSAAIAAWNFNFGVCEHGGNPSVSEECPAVDAIRE